MWIRIVGILVIVLILTVVLSISAFAKTPDTNASHIAQCATQMGGQHVANCAQIMDQGVSSCAQMNGPCTTCSP